MVLAEPVGGGSPETNGPTTDTTSRLSGSATSVQVALSGAPPRAERLGRRAHFGRRFWGLWTGTAISSSGDGLVAVALPLLAFSLTKSPFAIAAVTADQRACAAIAALPAGVVADRFDRRSVMLAANICSGIALALLVMFMSLGAHELLSVYVVTAVLSVSEVAYTAALQATVPDVVPAEVLGTGNGRLMGVAGAGENFVGPGIGGLLFSAARRLPFGADAVSFFLSALLVRASVPSQGARLRHGASRAKAPGSDGAGAGSTAGRPGAQGRRGSLAPGELRHGTGLTADFTAGLRAFRREPVLKLLAWTMASVNFTQLMVVGLLVVYAERVLHLTSTGYGLFSAGAAVMGVLGSFLGGSLLRMFGGAGVVVGGITLATISYLGLSFTKVAVLAVFVFGLQEFGAAVSNVGTLTVRQLLIPRHLYGRVASVQRFAIGITAPAGAMLGGVIASVSSVQLTFFIAASLQAVLLAYLGPSLVQAMKRQSPAA